jgi:hypothetical protein
MMATSALISAMIARSAGCSGNASGIEGNREAGTIIEADADDWTGIIKTD